MTLRNGLLTHADTEATPGEGKPSISERTIVIEDFSVDAPKTKGLIAKLVKLEASDVLIITEKVDQNLMLSSRNLPHVDVTDVEGINPVSLLSRKKVLMTQGAVKKLEAWLS